MMLKDNLKPFILDYCETAYGLPPTGRLNVFDARGLTKAEIDFRCGMAGYEPEVVSASLDELCTGGWLIKYPLGESDAKFFRGQTWSNYRGRTSQSVPSVPW